MRQEHASGSAPAARQHRRIVITGANVFKNGVFRRMDVSVEGKSIAGVGCDLPHCDNDIIIQSDGLFLVPGFADVHVHLREPGFSYKETIATGARAAARGGYTLICAMPNLNPPPDSVKNLEAQLRLIEKNASVRVIPYGCITLGREGRELADIRAMAGCVVGFSDDGSGVQDPGVMKRAMLEAKAANRPIAAHCEDESLLFGGYIHDGWYARRHGHAGISAQSEYAQISRDIALVRETGCRYHVCHVSAKGSVELIRAAKAEGLPITCETAPHYLALCEDDLIDDGRFKMNPPLRTFADRQELIDGIKDGTIDAVATDHAPHSAEEKSKGLKGSLMGVVGLETAFPALYTRLVDTGALTLESLIELMSVKPRRIFGLDGGVVEEGAPADITLVDMRHEYEIRPEEFESMGRSTPFEGMRVRGRTALTMVGGKIVYIDDKTGPGIRV